MSDDTPRWRYRFQNFARAFELLREAVDISCARPLSMLEQEGLVQRFEYSWELAWKLLKDYLDAQGVALETITPASVIRASFGAQLIENGEIWMQALQARNYMAHTYDTKRFEAVMKSIRTDYFPLLHKLHTDFSDR
jgi:nucleotidyltransferase substrate binding protein (TIGR01987 family)